MRSRAKIVTIVSVILIVFLGVRALRNVRFLAPAPKGIHGQYSLDAVALVFKARATELGEFLSNLNGLNLSTSELGNSRYLIGGIPCDGKEIEAYVEFDSVKISPVEMKVLWINADPTEDDDEYETLTRVYNGCLEAVLKKNNLVEDPGG